jgi:hypothetical protein
MEICFVVIFPCGLVKILFSTTVSGAGLTALVVLFTGVVVFDFRRVCLGKGRISILSVSPFFFQTLVSMNRVA